MLSPVYQSQTNRYGYEDGNGKIIIPFQYKEAGEFVHGVACVQNDEGHYGLINEKGDTILPFEYGSLYTHPAGWVHATKDNTHFLFTSDGQLQLSITGILSWYYPEEGLIRVVKTTGWGFMDMKGNTVIPFSYKALGPCKNGWISFYQHGQWGWLDKTGKEFFPPIFDEVNVWDHRYWWGRNKSRYTLYDYTGQLVKDEDWQKIIVPQEGMAAIKKQGRWQYIDENFDTLLQLKEGYEWVTLFCEKLAAVKTNGRWGFINAEGHEVIAPTWEQVKNFSESMAAVKQDNQWGYINTSGRLVIKCQYYAAGPFQNGRAWVYGDYAMWYINKQNKAVTEKIYED